MAINATKQGVLQLEGKSVIDGKLQSLNGGIKDGCIYDFPTNPKFYLKFTNPEMDNGFIDPKTGKQVTGEEILTRLILTSTKKSLGIKREVRIVNGERVQVHPWVFHIMEASKAGRSLLLYKVDILTPEGEAIYKKGKKVPSGDRTNFRWHRIAYFSLWEKEKLNVDVHGKQVVTLAKTGIVKRKSVVETVYIPV